MSALKEQSQLYASYEIANKMNTDIDWINAGEKLKDAIRQQIIIDIKVDDVTKDIKDILPDIKENEKDYIVIYKGEMYYVSNEATDNNENQRKWCEELGIKILEYKEPEGIAIRTGRYELIKGIYICTPKLDSGFSSSKTRYLEVTTSGNLTPGNWIDNRPNDSWYDYSKSQWANICVENEGASVYYVWIPRYCYKLNQTTQRSDVKFIDIDNSYKDVNGNITTWADLQTQGYQVPEAFKFNGQELSGYWSMKYTSGDITVPSVINFEMSYGDGAITVKSIKLNASITGGNPIAKYTVAINGKIVRVIDDPSQVSTISYQQISITDLKVGNNVVNVTGLNAAGEIVGTMTKINRPAIVNKPDLEGFDKNTTFYVTWDANNNEHCNVPITQDVPTNWYDYGNSKWANIVTRNNNLEVYYVWIPRYEYKLDQQNQRTIINFLEGTTTEASPEYQIPEAFKFNGKELRGYWAMKYTAADEAGPRFDTELVSTSSSIRTKGIIGTAKGADQIYKYYINGEYKGADSNSSNGFEFSGLNNNTEYTINVEIRRNSNDEYLGSITKKIKTIDANKPDLTGFNEDCTYYVLYDDSGNETLGDKVKKDGSNMPGNWYDYTKSKWANIVVKSNAKTTYFTWIPRYEFRMTSSQYAQQAIGRTDVRFIGGTSTETDTGYQIPEAFSFNGKQLTGYWAMKYTSGD